eukprot:XP_011605584.1 PREDICTED: tripartite motif-containing protein 44 isoform X2 [Takifugu rubripes]
MDHKEDHQQGATSLNNEELPQMDGTCDACEPDEAQMATLVCHKCSFAFCPLHAERHVISTHHLLAPYNHDNTPANGLGSIKDNSFGGGAGGEAGMGGNQRVVGGDAGLKRLLSGLEVEPVVGEGPVGAEAGQEVSVSADQKRDTVTVERLRCMEHEQEGSLYCKMDEKIICVVCAVQGEHRAHEIITLQEAYLWQKGRQGYDLLGSTQQMAEKIKTKWTSPEMTTEELEDYVNAQFDELRKLVRLEEKRSLHLVDLKEAFLTASAAEKIAEISLETERLQEEMASITDQLCLLEKAEGGRPAVRAGDIIAAPEPAHRVQRDIDARPRLPEPRANPVDLRDFEDSDTELSMDHAP